MKETAHGAHQAKAGQRRRARRRFLGRSGGKGAARFWRQVLASLGEYYGTEADPANHGAGNFKLQTPNFILLRQKHYGGQGEATNSKLQPERSSKV